ncbi:Xaa-Arg dipeptidase [Cladobotryum mycophilum]|uniref:Xaa-Arg dipeptidase n=1 Tax=Cladobotryum mycophilum TaxID=491253 RepID=A0ABR0SIF0_9HYPO
MHFTAALFVATAVAVRAIDTTQLSSFLKQASSATFPGLKDIAVEIWNAPEVGLDEHHAHDLITSHFSAIPGWQVTPHSFGLDTAFTAVYSNRPSGFTGALPVIGVTAEYDALVGIGHACGHNLIALNAISVASLISQALVNFNLPGTVILQGCPDEENAAGKFKLNNAGAFDAADVWIMAHPTTANAIQPMNARLNFFATLKGNSHAEAVSKAFQSLNIVLGLSGKLPATSSTAVGIENIGTYATNIVQQLIPFGVAGLTLQQVNATVASILDASFPGVAYTIGQDPNGVALNLTGPGGHASEATKGPLVLATETFNALNGQPGVSFFLPGNTTSSELDITIDMRTRYTSDLPQVAQAVNQALGSLPSSLSNDVKYPALEVTPFLPDLFVNIIGGSDYGISNFPISTFAPASTDFSYVQEPVLDPSSHQLLSAGKAALHANFGICGPNLPWPTCPFNHEPNFRILAGMDFGYQQTEIVARAEAQLAIELLADPAKMANATAIIKK